MNTINNSLTPSLVRLLDRLGLDESTYRFCVSRRDPLAHSIQNVARSAVRHHIKNYLDAFDPFLSDDKLHQIAICSYLKKFNWDACLPELDENIELVRKCLLPLNFYNDVSFDQLRCFLKLTMYRGPPMFSFITKDKERQKIEKIVYKGDFVITETRDYIRHGLYLDIDYSYHINASYSQLLLILAGDIELNPGPFNSLTVTVEHVQRRKICQMEREITKLKKLQERHKNHIQRQLELEKRNRKRNREARADYKYHAQSLVTNDNQAQAQGVISSAASGIYKVCTGGGLCAEVARCAACIGANSVVPGLGTAGAAVMYGARSVQCASKVSTLVDMLQGLVKVLTESAESLRNTFQVAKDYDLIGILMNCFSICYGMQTKNYVLLSVACATLARQLYVSFDMLMSLVSVFQGGEVSFGTGGNTERVAQSLVSDMYETAKKLPELLPFASILSFLCGIFSLLCTGTVPTPSEMTKHFSAVGRASQGFKAIKDMFVWIFDYLSEIYYTTVHGVSKEEYQFMKHYPDLEKLYAAVRIIEKFDTALIDSSADIANQIMTVTHQLTDYHTKAFRSSARNSAQFIASLLNRIKDQQKAAQCSPARCHTIRTEPFSLYLYGHPGVGKSVATEMLKASIFKEYLEPRGVNFDNAAYARHIKSEYWDAYAGQPICVLDDFANTKDSQAKPDESLEELIYMVNTAQYPLHMADLNSKGITNFTSDFIIASSNQQYPHIVSLVDPGAVYRRFHIWAEVTIDPAYGKPIGLDNQGNPYHKFDQETAMKKLGDKARDPLLTEHYRFKCYTVMHNKQTGAAQVIPIDGKSKLTFDEFWDYYKFENDRRRNDSDRLADAIRKRAGIDTPAPRATEKQIMDQFDKIFNPEKFIEAVADDGVLPEGDTLQDADEKIDSSLLGSLREIVDNKLRIAEVKTKFSSYCNEFKATIKYLWEKLYKCVDYAKNKLVSIAEFFMSFFSAAAGYVQPYLPKIKTAHAIAGVLASLTAVAGLWFTGIFSPSQAISCKFNKEPSNATNPCFKCKACDVIQYPKRGDMVSYYMSRTGSKAVLQSLEDIGIERDIIYEARETLREIERVHASAQRANSKCELLGLIDSGYVATKKKEAFVVMDSICRFNCGFCDDFRILPEPWEIHDEAVFVNQANNLLAMATEYRAEAQGVYETQPRVARPVAYAQGVYDQQPRMPKGPKLAQSWVSCIPDVEFEVGARRHAQRDTVQVQQTTQVLLNNSVWIQAIYKSGNTSRSNGVFLVGRTMATTAHTLDSTQEDPIEAITIRNPYSTAPSITVPFKDCKVTHMKQMDDKPIDIVLVSFPGCVSNRPKILSKFLDAENISLLNEGSLIFSGFHEVNGKTIIQEKYPSTFKTTHKATIYSLHSYGTCPASADVCKHPIRIGNHIEYDLETYGGMCGALLSISNKMIHTKLVGLHVAGGTQSMALGVLLTRQLLEAGLDTHVKEHNIPKSYLIDGRLPHAQTLVNTNVQVSLLDHGDCLSVGSAPSPAAPIVTQLGPSLVFDKVQKHIAKPAHLKPVMLDEELVDPMLKGIKKIMGSQIYVDADLVEAAANDVFQGLGPPPSGTGIVHSYEEAIVGIQGDAYKRPINRTTSPGYPYNLDNKEKGKTKWLGNDEVYIVDHPELKRDVEELLEDARNAVRGNAISIATLKDEKRPIAKVDAGKTRVFEACPQHLVIAMRQYFLDFAAHVMRNRIDNGIAVGINPYSLEWTKLAHHLQTKGNNMIAGDFSNFDGSLLMQILVKIVEKINEWYNDDEESKLIRTVLWEHISNADILVRGEVIRKTHSQPSGNPLTVIVNSLFNGIVMRIAYLMLKKEHGLPMICDYREHVAEIIYGDDDIKSVSVTVLDWFNQITITEALASFGLTYTDETKAGTTLKCKPLEEVAFLKRKFALQKDGTYMAPMDLTNTLEITNWIRGKAKYASTVENCEQVIRELALHPKDVYEKWSARIRQVLAEVGLNIKVPTYWEQMQKYHYDRDNFELTEYEPLW